MQEERTIVDVRISMGEAFKLGSGFGIGFLLSPFTMLLWGLARLITLPIRWWFHRQQES